VQTRPVNHAHAAGPADAPLPGMNIVRRVVHPGKRSSRPSALRKAASWIFSHMDRSRTLGLAAETAFWLFLALLPLAAVTGMIAARAAVSSPLVTSSVTAALPPGVGSILFREMARVAAWNGGAVGPVAGAVFLWLASNGVHAIFDAIEVEVSVSRPWWKKRLLAIVTCIGLSIGVAIVTLLGTGIEWILTLVGETSVGAWALASSWSMLVMRLALGALIAFGLIVGLYRIGVPRACARKIPFVPGAAFAVLLQLLLGFAYAAWVSRMGDSGAYLAGLAAIGVALTALYLAVLSFLLGLQVNLYLLHVKEPRDDKRAESPAPPAMQRLPRPSTP